MSRETKKICSKGHVFYKSSDCPTCPICDKKSEPTPGFLSQLSAPARRALEGQKITTLNKLATYSQDEILSLHGMGPASLPILEHALKEKGLSFKKEVKKMKQIVPYLFFEGICREAMTYYNDLFKGELKIMTVGESPMAEKMPDMQDRILHAAIMIDGKLMLMASDTMMPGQTAEMGEGVYNTLICNTKDEIESLFETLSSEGKVNMPLEQSFFGWFGSLTDKFGVKWMLEFDTPQSQ